MIFDRGSKHIINSKWIKDLNAGPESMKIIEENISSKILDTIFSS